MKKIKLNITELKIDSFVTTEKANKNGTVNGNGRITDLPDCLITSECLETKAINCLQSKECQTDLCMTLVCPSEICNTKQINCNTNEYFQCIQPDL